MSSIAVLVIFQSKAQVLFNDGQTISFNNGILISVIGGAENQGTISQEGELFLTGDWSNIGLYTSTSGYLHLTDENAQLINHNDQDMPNLVIDGTGDKTLLSPMTISSGGSINLISGLLFTSETEPLMIQNTVDVFGGSDESFVSGPLYHEGTGFKYFPIGKGRRFGGLELENVDGTNPIIGYEVFNTNPDPQRDFQLNAISRARHWERRFRAGEDSYTGSVVSLYVNTLESFPFIDDIGVSQSDSLGGLFLPLGQGLVEGNIADGGWVSSIDSNTKKILALASISGVALEQLIFVPNVFAPSSTNIEEQILKVYGRDILEEGFEFKIYNRWGNLIYETNSFIEANTIGWDGITEETEENQESLYKYFLTGTLVTGKQFSRQGSIRLLR